MSRVEDQAICLRAWEWSETSQTVCVLTRAHGLVRGIAKGSKRPRSAFSGGFEPVTCGNVGVLFKPGRELALLTHWELTWMLIEARRDIRVFFGAMYVADLAGRLIQDHDPHPGLFDALKRCLETLDRGVERSIVAFQWAALIETGHKPELERDVRTGAPAQTERTAGFSPELGGLVADPGRAARGGSWRVRGETIDHLRAVARGETPEGDIQRCGRLLDAYAEYLVGRKLAASADLWGERPGATSR